MDNQLTNSRLLEHILDFADKIKITHSYKILTVNHVMAAALEFCNPSSVALNTRGFDVSEISALISVVNSVKLSDNISFCLDILCGTKPTFMDDLLFRQVVAAATDECREKGMKNITADIFVKCIIESPSDEIKNLISCAEKTDGQLTDYPELTSEELTDALNDMRRLLAGVSETKPEKDEDENPDEEQKEEKLQPKEYIAGITEKVKFMQKKLSGAVFGQDNAINIFASGYFQAQLRKITDKKSKKPKATYLFAGPPGVGKTFLAEQAAEMLGLPFMRFDMSEFSERDALMELIGTNKSYKGDKEGSLTGFVNKNPECVLLFDEIEKANIAVIHLFLQVLDAGRLRDTNSGKEVDFSDTILIFTTNAGRKIYENSLTPNLSGISRKTILKALETDVDPKTGLGSFPAAICSRFATGNVIMFNHMEAHSLRRIAENEILRNTENLLAETGISCTVSDDVYSCILFSEGGHADARTVKSRANSFFSTELYELFRLVSNNDNNLDIRNIENINITLELPADGQVRRLFRDDSKGRILSFGDFAMCGRLTFVAEEKGYKNIIVSSLHEAKAIINSQDVEFVCCDLHSEKCGSDALNIEDVRSDGRDFFRYVCESTDTPLYILSDNNHKYTDEEIFSLCGEGARGVIDAGCDSELTAAVADILLKIHHQQSMTELAKSSRLIKYETSQSVSEDGKTAEIRLFDITCETAVDAEDGGNILSDVSKPDVKFSDIIGAEGAKSELRFFVDYLKNPKAFSSKGLGVPKGVLFYGPPGTGKTMLAKAVAGESDVTFICAEGNQFLKKYVGEGEEAVHNLFATARKYAPAIIFIDEIDAIAKERTGGEYSAESILTAFLAEMDGFRTDAKKPVFVLAATNYKVEPGTEKSLDGAFLRRFDRHIYIDLPDKKARIEYIKMKIKDKPVFSLSEDEIENIAVRSTGMSLAQLASVFEFSLRIAVRENRNEVNDELFEEAFETFNHGEERKWDITELRKTAYHEAGHAFLCWHGGETPSYLTVVSRGNHGGYMQHGDTENRGSFTKKMLMNRIRTALGGRAAELVFFGDEEGMTTGASSDLKTATVVARSIVCNYGMDENIGLSVIGENELSDPATAKQVRDAVNDILRNELESAKTILDANRPAIDKIVGELLLKNHLTAKEIDEIFSKYSEK